MFKKNDEIEIYIEDQGIDGEGIGKIDGYPIFVKGALIGDTVKCGLTKIKKNFAYARLIDVISPSKSRVEALCPISSPCGGCQLQSLDYAAQLDFKTQKVFNNLKRLGGVDFKSKNIEFSQCIGMDEPWRYRNKAQVPFGYDKEGKLIAGFYVGRTHQIIPMSDCMLGASEFGEIIKIIKSFMIKNDISAYDEKAGKGLVRHALLRKGFGTNEILVCIVINGKKLPLYEKLIEKLQTINGFSSFSININQEDTNVILGKKTITLWGKETIEDTISDLKFTISPQSFFQVNHIQTEKLYAKALEFANLTGNEIVWDLYCGAGTISLFLARNAKKVYGVEIVEPAIINAKENAKNNNIRNVEFFCGDAKQLAPKLASEPKYKPDVVVVDPPRKGCDEDCLEAILKMNPDRIVYVSCDSATLARDIKYLTNEGSYKLSKVQPIDMFPHTVHVETVCLLSRKAPV